MALAESAVRGITLHAIAMACVLAALVLPVMSAQTPNQSLSFGLLSVSPWALAVLPIAALAIAARFIPALMRFGRWLDIGGAIVAVIASGVVLWKLKASLDGIAGITCIINCVDERGSYGVWLELGSFLLFAGTVAICAQALLGFRRR